MYDLNQANNGASAATKKLPCTDVMQDIVALSRGELAPLRAEQVRSHLESCPECREEALELELSMRSWSSLEDLPMPKSLQEKTTQTLRNAGFSITAETKQQTRTGTKILKAIQNEELETSNFLLRPRSSLAARLGAIAALFIAVLFCGNHQNAEAIDRMQRKVLGKKLSVKILKVTESVLDKLQI